MSVTVQHTKFETSTEERNLISCIVTRQNQDAAREPEIELVFQIVVPDVYQLSTETRFAFLLSSTRTDTREPVQLGIEELTTAMEAVSVLVAENSPGW